jgi:hypothetical protein
MGYIRFADNKPQEYSDLETHVTLSKERNQVLEDRIARTDSRIDKMIEQADSNKKLMIGAVITLISGLSVTFYGKLLSWISS